MKKPAQTKFDLSNIENPDFLKSLSFKDLDYLCNDIRENIIQNVANNGGHLSSNLGVVESTVALCRSFDFSKDKIVFDVGHQCYTYKILTGRSLERLRQKDGISGFQKISESPYDHFEAGHSSTAISVANGLAVARDFKKEKYDVVAFVGDSSIVNGLSFEGLNNGSRNHKMIIVCNFNDMSISAATGAVARLFRNFSTSSFYRKQKNFFIRITKKTRFGRWFFAQSYKIKCYFKRRLIKMGIFDNLGYSVVGPVDGHNIKQLESAFKRAKQTEKSVVVLIKTIKGKGYSLAENDQIGSWHGVGPFNKVTGEPLGGVKYTWSNAVRESLDSIMKENEKTTLIVPGTALGSDLNVLFNEYSNRCIDVGIAEEHAATFSGALSKEGFHPFISMYSTFSQRAYDELSHDIARMNLSATLLLDRSGLVGNDGNTHQGLYDESYLMTIPNTVVTMPSRTSEIKTLLEESTKGHGLFAIRYPRESTVKCENTISLKFGEWIKELDGEETAIVSVGPDTIKLKSLLTENNKKVALYNAVYVHPILAENIDTLIKYSKVIIYDSYATTEGFAKSLTYELVKANYKGKIVVKTVPTVFVDQATIGEQKKEFGITPEDIVEII